MVAQQFRTIFDKDGLWLLQRSRLITGFGKSKGWYWKESIFWITDEMQDCRNWKYLMRYQCESFGWKNWMTVVWIGHRGQWWWKRRYRGKMRRMCFVTFDQWLESLGSDEMKIWRCWMQNRNWNARNIGAAVRKRTHEHGYSKSGVESKDKESANRAEILLATSVWYEMMVVCYRICARVEMVLIVSGAEVNAGFCSNLSTKRPREAVIAEENRIYICLHADFSFKKASFSYFVIHLFDRSAFLMCARQK